MTALLLTLVLLLVLALWRPGLGFRSQRPADYAGTGPAMDIRHALSGPIQCEGMIHGPTGRLSARFTARMHGDWQGDLGILSEDFTYATGRTQHREWTLRMGENGAFTATAPDIIGTAHGQQSGCTARLTYRIRLEPDAGGHVLDVTDWLYLLDDGTILNRSELRKFGLKVAELTAVMRPIPHGSGK